MKTAIIATAAMATGFALGYIITGATARKYQRKIRAMRAERSRSGKMGVMDKVLVLEAVVLIIYTAAALVVFWHTGAEPATLTACVFGVCGLENGVMGWIKTNKDKATEQTKRPTGRDEQPQEWDYTGRDQT